jgi:hypothetical protein
MSKMIKTTLIALSILAGATAGYAADGGRDNPGGRVNGPGGIDAGQQDSGDLDDRQLIDPNSTGSIVSCESGAYDEFGNCIVDPGMQP